ncbi:uncharacterized protein HLK63_H08745 [Nakaseomyces glabratus]|nr:uncharacterized protein GW608_H08745 [Nakaseomyces glabratus]UCS26390.1 uncharacterized protein HLK63_H08745 [Nakaseomyces glabratus]UCS31620.1 uncharacterized protein HLK64_H08745 [Nakaseomyces glabratus]UCS36848.1 uncharacterized protein HLK62_H08745 [Nakaseomyces glabratus]
MSYNQVTPIALGQRSKRKIVPKAEPKDDKKIEVQANKGKNVLKKPPVANTNSVVNPAVSVFPQPNKVRPSRIAQKGPTKQNNTNGSNRTNKKLKSNEGKVRHPNNNRTNSSGGLSETERRRKRAERFSKANNTISKNELEHEDNFSDLNSIGTKSHIFNKDQRIVGRCQKLEKSYLRLTSEPNPEMIRPPEVLEKALEMLMEKYKNKEVNYTYLCDQFKSIRQDLRVQMIEDSFTMTVYQEHARIALENDDLGEFNQCQSRLMVLYDNTTIKRTHREEFTVYLILYYVLMQDYSAIDALKLELIRERGRSIKNAGIALAFEIAETRQVGNYHKFMKLCASLKGLGQKLIKAFMDQEILKTLVTICRSYNQVNLVFLTKELEFETADETIQYLKRKNLGNYIVTKNLNMPNEFKYLDTKACRIEVIQAYAKLKKVDIKGQK